MEAARPARRSTRADPSRRRRCRRHGEHRARPSGGHRPGRRRGRTRKAQQDLLPELTLAALRWARANDPDFPPSVDKRGAELLHRVGDLKTWARNRPRAATGTTDLE
ncbi:hypothetical protein [Streptomyces sp. H39-C1]|uniref:hypothetical protein n=1 Tax=Streptomyces sp. H39-C1 TaxID=3004355 RepID=UPI0022B0020F|nr:hypothetical protein [Streptomyces sp. H39-C1]MCZ4102569.1 hypothetical protein [Streptomyces sp. H39-C1]